MLRGEHHFAAKSQRFLLFLALPPGVARAARNTHVEKNPHAWLHCTNCNLGLCDGNIACRIFSPCVSRELAMRTHCLQLIAAATLMLCTGCQACLDSFNRFEAWKTERCCNIFHHHRQAPPPVVFAPVQQCPQPVVMAPAPCAQPAPICAPIQCDPCAQQATQVSSAAPCCPQPCCPPAFSTNECCPSPCSTGYATSSGGDACCNSTSSGGVIVNEQPTYRDGGTTIQNTPNLAPGPAAIGR